MRYIPSYVYIIFNDCPEDWDRPSIMGVYGNKRDADREAKIIIGGNQYAMQYIVVKKWRVK